MGMTFHFAFSASADRTAEQLEDFLRVLEGEAIRMGFYPTIVINALFDSADGRSFARRLTTGLSVEDKRLKKVDLPKEMVWGHNAETGSCRLVPTSGVVLVITDELGRETVFGFFRYPGAIYDCHGREIMSTPGDGWTFRNFVCSPDPRFRLIVQHFADAGFASSVSDEFASLKPSPGAAAVKEATR